MADDAVWPGLYELVFLLNSHRGAPVSAEHKSCED
jgi:hypothetical protein